MLILYYEHYELSYFILLINMKNNPYILAFSIALGLSMGAYLPNGRIGYILFNILRGIR